MQEKQLMKAVQGIYIAPRQHWVGDGFPVRSLFSYDNFGQAISPFLLLDYAGPTTFTPTTEQRGVGSHPHRGFETVTIVYNGEVSHKDSSGGGGTIGAGDVQWMTAGSGLVHEEFHSRDYATNGGPFEMVQLWVNLPAKDKMTHPRYQGLLNADIPVVNLDDNAGTLRIIAGNYANQNGAAKTFSPVNVWDVQLNAGKRVNFTVPDGFTTALVILNGSVLVNANEADPGYEANPAQLVLLEQNGSEFSIEAKQDAKLLVLSGEPLNEPIEGYGPFVMNTREEIRQAITDFNNGKFGEIVVES